MKPYLDSNIWVSYIWFSYYGKGEGTKKSKIKVVEHLSENIILTPITSFIASEVSKHFSEWILFQKAMRDGYSFWQWKNIRKKIQVN